jgi:N-acetylmuramoyl-L-alanine amidase
VPEPSTNSEGTRRMQIREHHLYEDDGTALRFVTSPNHGDDLQPLYLVIHYTAAPWIDSTLGWFQDSRSNASAHIIVDRNGDAVQMVPLNRRAWHAGQSRWDGLDNLNAYAIGIELVNAGALDRSPDGEWITWAGHRIPPEDVLVARHKHEASTRGWQVFPDVQIARAITIARALHDRYRFRDVLGHDDVAPGRKIDPGPAFPMTRFASEVLGLATMEEERR